MTRQNDTAYGINRLESKNARAAIIQKISADFNLMPIVAEAYYQQISTYFAQHADVKLTSGQICYEAVAAEEPAGKHIALAKKVSCRLTLNDTQVDLEVLATYGLAGLRRHRILRLTQEAYDQDALLSYEDLAILLTTSPASVKRDIRALKHDGYFVMTRGAKHDMGTGGCLIRRRFSICISRTTPSPRFSRRPTTPNVPSTATSEILHKSPRCIIKGFRAHRYA